ncbi:thiamine pyrophosphate-binding protein [Natronorarus salvus]|uniref:thiamine pyrophosphate-binding protein n=1 Tax=Natronorarus salvus TaxID=3117733 RepID=UPI002F2697CB
MRPPSSGASLFVEILERYGVTHLFGNPGTTELPILEALADSDVEYVLALHEDVAVGMAAGYASTRRYHSHHDSAVLPVGIVNLHLIGGLSHGLGNLYNARTMGTPLVVTAGDYARTARHEEPILSGDLVALARPFTKWSTEVRDVEALPAVMRRAFRIALTPPTGPVFVSLPLDVLTAETTAAPERLGPIPNAGRGDPGQIELAADLLAEAEEPLLVVGDGVARAGYRAIDAAREFAEAAGARVYGELYASEIAFPTDHPQWISYLPLANDDLARELLDTDTIVFVGCSTNDTFLRRGGDLVGSETTCVHVTDTGTGIGKNQPADAAIVGDPGLVMADLARLLSERLPDDDRADRRYRIVDEKPALVERLSPPTPPEPEEGLLSKPDLVDALRDAFPDAYVVDEGLTAKMVLLARWHLAPERYLSNKGLCLGYGLPASIGAALAERQVSDPLPVVGFVGDGSYLYYPQAVYTAVRYGVDLTVVVPDNRNYRILKNNYRRFFAGERLDALGGLDFDPPVDIAANAGSQGADALSVRTPEELDAALRSARETPGPAVLDVRVQD